MTLICAKSLLARGGGASFSRLSCYFHVLNAHASMYKYNRPVNSFSCLCFGVALIVLLLHKTRSRGGQ
eukprot:scaffold14348_cov155-Skeletonema_dohrnii-CCMP3373.AAC.2